MPQKISISRWNIGESSLRSIGDYDQPLYNSTCRFLRNFVPSETGKLWRRPGFEHHVNATHEDARIVTYYLPDDTLVLLFYLDGVFPDQTMKFDWYILEDVAGSPKKQFIKKTTHSLLTGVTATTFKAADFSTNGRPATADLKRLSYVQVDNYLYVTHPNMEHPFEVKFDYATFDFDAEDFSTGDRSYYFDVNYDATVGAEKWNKTVQTDFEDGGGTAAVGVAGWTAYTGKEFTGANQGKNDTPGQTFTYLSCVTFAFERLVWGRGPRVHGSGGGDPLSCGFQYNGDIPADIKIDPYVVLPSDPFLYRASSDLGYEDFTWLAGGPLLMGGANNGAWVLSNPQVGLDATNPLMYKATSNGAHWVPGKTVGDAMIYFQRPGRQLNEFLFTNASQNYVATNLSEFSDHIFFDSQPTEMVIQRSPFNVAWILREDGQLVTFTYDRQRQMYAWAQHPFVRDINVEETIEAGKVLSMGIYSDGIIDRLVTYVERPTNGSVYRALELMDIYTPSEITGTFVDAAELQKLEGDWSVLDIVQDDVNGHWIYYDFTYGDFANDQILNFPGATRTDDGVPDFASNDYDYIYGQWTVFDIDIALHRMRIKDSTGQPYTGIWQNVADPATTLAYIDFGSARRVTASPLAADTRFLHLAGQLCKSLMDGTPNDIYVSVAGDIFYDADTIPDDWDGNEALLTENAHYWNDIIIGLPYETVFSPLVLKKQISKGKLTKMELEVFRSLGGTVGTGEVTLDNKLVINKTVELTYPAVFEEGDLYTGTIKPKIVGGFADDPLWFLLIDDAVPFNITNVIYYLEAN